jgi:hypothetical protein
MVKKILDYLCRLTFICACVGSAMLICGIVASGVYDLWMTNWRATALCCVGILTIAMAVRGLILFGTDHGNP